MARVERRRRDCTGTAAKETILLVPTFGGTESWAAGRAVRMSASPSHGRSWQVHGRSGVRPPGAHCHGPITEGVFANGWPLAPPMAFWAYRHMTQQELGGLVACLRSLPPQP